MGGQWLFAGPGLGADGSLLTRREAPPSPQLLEPLLASAVGVAVLEDLYLQVSGSLA